MTQVAEATFYDDRTFKAGITRVTYNGLPGTVVKITERRDITLLHVLVDDPTKLSARDYYQLNPASAAQHGKSHFNRPLDHGLSAGNFELM